MKKNIKGLLIILAGVFIISSCQKMLDKKDNLPPYASAGNTPVLSSDVATVSPKPEDSSTAVINFSWTSPQYATDSSTVKYTLEIDSSATATDGGFKRELTGVLTTSLTGKELNSILLGWGFALGESHEVSAKVISSYANHNEEYTSNVVAVMVSPYGDSSVLASSATEVTCALATADQHAVDFSWSAAFNGYSGAVTYTLQYDSSGQGFDNPKEIAIDANTYTKSLTQGEINLEAINSGVIGGSSGNIDYRIKAVTALGALVYSNIVTIKVSTFISAPDNLYIVGDATPGGWSNPVPVPTQQFTKVDDYSFSLIVYLNAAPASYLFLPVNGDWSHKYGGTSATGGTLLKDGEVPGSNTPAPATAGLYKITVNFQTNSYSVTPVTVPDNLYIVGDATDGGWSNPVPTPSQHFTQLSPGVFGIIANLKAGSVSYLFLPVNGDWSHKYGGASATGGTLLADGDVPGSNTPAPATAGVYKIIVNFATNTYSVTPYTGVPLPSSLFIVGDATAGGWSNPVPTPSQQFTQLSNGEFKITLPLYAGNSYLFLPVNGDWSHKYGGTSATGGTLLYDGDVPGSNTPAPSSNGTYTIDVNFITGTYSVK